VKWTESNSSGACRNNNVYEKKGQRKKNIFWRTERNKKKGKPRKKTRRRIPYEGRRRSWTELTQKKVKTSGGWNPGLKGRFKSQGRDTLEGEKAPTRVKRIGLVNIRS